MQTNLTKFHYFLDEAGDSTYFGKGNLPILNTLGVSKCFSIGICTFNEPLQQIRNKILALKAEIKNQIIFDVVNQKHEPLLNFTDYLCWAVQRKYEKEENRFMEFLGSKIKSVKII